MHLSAVKDYNRYFDVRFGIWILIVGAVEDLDDGLFAATTRAVAIIGRREFSICFEKRKFEIEDYSDCAIEDSIVVDREVRYFLHRIKVAGQQEKDANAEQ